MAELLDIASASGPGADEVVGGIAEYFAQHLTWAGPLLEAAVHRAETDFYRSAIQMTRELLKSDESFWATRP